LPKEDLKTKYRQPVWRSEPCEKDPCFQGCARLPGRPDGLVRFEFEHTSLLILTEDSEPPT